MKDHPILFSGAMIRAILDGTKTQTRRVLNQQPLDVLATTTTGQWIALTKRAPEPRGTMFRCRYGVPGDRLWVRETWSLHDDGVPAYKADATPEQLQFYKWHPSIHMPRRFSRITLELTDVRVERIQAISLDDMRAEGVQPDHEASLLWRETLQENFRTLWDSINAKRGYSWESNPWVWVLDFKRVN